MAVSSLTRMTVPLASDQSSPTQGLLMPKLKYRFRVVFENLGVSTPRTELTKQVMDFTRPNLSFGEIEIPIYNSRIYLAGKHEWQPCTVNFRDDASGSVARLLGEQLQKQMDFVEQASASAGIDYKFITRCEILDGGNGASTPNVLETWELYGCYINTIDYGNVDYSVSEPVTIQMTMRFDNALQTPLGDGLGATVGRTTGDVVTG
jgi:hypothetical protein